MILFTTFLDTVVQWHNPVTTTSKIRIQQQAQLLVNSKTSLKIKNPITFKYNLRRKLEQGYLRPDYTIKQFDSKRNL